MVLVDSSYQHKHKGYGDTDKFLYHLHVISPSVMAVAHVCGLAYFHAL